MKSSFEEESVINKIIDYNINDIPPSYWYAVENNYIRWNTQIITPALQEDDIKAAIDLINFMDSKDIDKTLQLEDIQLYKLMKQDKSVTDRHLVSMLYNQNYRVELLRIYNTNINAAINCEESYIKIKQEQEKAEQDEKKAELRTRPLVILGRIIAFPLVFLYSLTLMPFDNFLTGSSIDWGSYFSGADKF